MTSATTSPATRRAVVLAGPATPPRQPGLKYPQVAYAGMSLSLVSAQLLQAKVTATPVHLQIVLNKFVSANKITFSGSHSASSDGRSKTAFECSSADGAQ
jgi:hypothetical protein